MSRYKLSKFKRGDKVNSPGGEGHIYEIQFMDGQHWYELGEHSGFYREDELKLISKSNTNENKTKARRSD
jgi:hypothetical protein